MTDQGRQLISIVDEVLGPIASKSLVSRLDTMIEGATDARSLEEAANKAGKLVTLFLGPEPAIELQRRFARVLR